MRPLQIDAGLVELGEDACITGMGIDVDEFTDCLPPQIWVTLSEPGCCPAKDRVIELMTGLGSTGSADSSHVLLAIGDSAALLVAEEALAQRLAAQHPAQTCRYCESD